MGGMAYNYASWRIRVGHLTEVVIHIKGCDSDRDVQTPEQLAAAGDLLRKIGNALRRVLGPEETQP